jgi:hypothetical protein
MFFYKKYTLTILNSKWEPIKNNLKLNYIPRKGEYIYMDSKYFDVLNVVHMLNGKHKIFIIVEESTIKLEIKNN